MRFLGLILIAAFFSSTVSHATSFQDEYSAAEEQWARLHFYGKASDTSFPDLKSKDYLEFDREKCEKSVDHLLELTANYQLAAFKSSKVAHRDFGNLHHFIFVTLGTEHPCFDPVAKIYLLESLKMLDPYAAKSAVIKHHIDLYTPGSPAAFLLTAGLLNNNPHPKIQILTPALRKTLGPGWEERSQLQKEFTSPYRLRGAYSCSHSEIFIDPEIGPINLASNITHELDHLIRDRGSSESDPKSNLGWKSTLLQDEVMALSAGFLGQLILSKQSYPKTNYYKSFQAGSIIYDYNHFQSCYELKNDRDLFSSGGSYETLFNSIKEDGTLHTFLMNTILNSNPDHYAYRSQVQAIYNSVNEVYFPESTLSDEYLLSVLKKYATDQRTIPDGLAHWLWVDAPWLSTNVDSPEKHIWEIRLGNVGNFRIQVSMTQILKATADLITELDTPSPLCKALIADQDDPEVKAYVGSRLSIGTAGGESGVKGGESGVKGVEPVSACMFLEKNQ